MSVSHHHWIQGGTRAERADLLATLRLSAVPIRTIDAHARLRGPYTAAGTLLREIAPDSLTTSPDLFTEHDIELLTAAPELRTLMPASRETLTSLAIPQERTRNYARLRTLRIAHGIAEFVRDHLTHTGPRIVVWENVDHADHTDLEVLSVLLRRVDPDVLCNVICTGAEPAQPLLDALARDTERHEIVARSADGNVPSYLVQQLARQYVDGDCVSDDYRQRSAYALLENDAKAALHDRRAAQLAEVDEISLRLGAIPFHLGHGTDPVGAGADAVRFAVDHCFDHGLYHASLALGELGIATIGDDSKHPLWFTFVIRMATPLAVLERTDDALALYIKAQANTEDPSVHLQVAYSLAMLNTRHRTTDARDHLQAKAMVNQAIVMTRLVFDERDRAFQEAFMRNGLALVEVHLGNPEEAARLVTRCIDHLNEVLKPEQHLLHRSVLRNNRSQVYAALGRLDEALLDIEAAMAVDPQHAEYHFDRGNLLRKVGRNEEAVASYGEVMRLSPPFSEAYYNRGDLLAEMGDLEGALRDFSYVLELDPDWLDARLNLVGVLIELGRLTEARTQALHGLAVAPDSPHLRCALGQIHAELAEYGQARTEFDRAIALLPTLVPALAGRASCAHELGDAEQAVADLTAAVALSPADPALLFNRAMVWRELARWDEFTDDLTTALTYAPDDEDIKAALAESQAQSIS